MFNVDSFDNLEPLQIYLAEPDGRLLYILNYAIDEDTASLSPALNAQYELTFTINSHYYDINTQELKTTHGYDRILEGMYLVVENVGLFRMQEPEFYNEGLNEQKNITAYSCDCELENPLLDDIEINEGTESSQEYLVEYEDGETEDLVNEYTNIPYDWILFYNTLPQQIRQWLSQYNSGYFGTPNSDITLTDSNKIKKINEMCTLCERLKYKTTRDKDGNIIGRNDYVVYTYNGEDISSIFISANFGSRLSELITYYDKYHKQLSLLDIVLEKMDGTWSVGEIYGLSNNDFSLCNKKFQFDIHESLYSFLTQTLAQLIECVVTFDIVNRKINVTPTDKLGEYSGIILSYDNLLNNVSIDCEESNITTRLYVTGADDLDIRFANIGQAYIEDLTYKMNARDINGKRIYVSDSLAQKYENYIQYFKSQRSPWIELTKQWNQLDIDIDELNYRVPLDSLKINWGTYKKNELEEAYTSYNNMLNSLITLYKNDFGQNGLNEDGSVNEFYMKNTPYWYDYVGYKETILEIQCAMDTYPYYSNQSKWTDSQIGNWKDIIKAWETNWELYGIKELQTKINSYEDKMSIMVDTSLVYRKDVNSDEIKTWEELNNLEKSESGSIEASYKNSYDLYNEQLKNRNSAQKYLASLQIQLESLETKKESVQSQRNAIKNNVDKSKFFTLEERKILNLLYKDAEYTNENILITSLDTTVTEVDVQKELVADGEEKLSALSRPQLRVNAEMENLLGLPEFKMMWNDFVLGNYIYVELPDGIYAKLRLTKYTFNPLIPNNQDLTVEFSNYITYSSKTIDSAYLLGIASTQGISSYSSGAGGGNGLNNFDEISNTLLKKLLESETFGTRVSNIALDTMTLNELTAKKAIFGGLATGYTWINGRWIKTGWITDGAYNGNSDTGSITNDKGSIINLETGKFNFAGGKLVWDGKTLHIDGTIAWDNITGKDNVATKDDIDGISGNVDELSDTFMEFQNAFSKKVNLLEEQTNQKIETWYQSTDPSAKWKNDDTKLKHKGDLWFDTNSQLTFIYNGSEWEETKTAPPDDVFDRIDGKAQIFVSQPIPPYNIGDLWFTDSSEILTCIKKKTKSQSFDLGDWEKKNKYTDDSSLSDFINNTYTESINYLKDQIDGKMETFYQSTDPSINWTSDDKKKHIGDLWYKITERTIDIFNGESWEETTEEVPDEVWNQINGKAQIFTTQPVSPYNSGDLWFTSDSEIMTCIHSRIENGAFYSSDWKKLVKYTSNEELDQLKDSIGYTIVGNKSVISPLIQAGTIQGSTIESSELISATIKGGQLLIGDEDGIYAKIDTNGKLTASGGEFFGNVVATSMTAQKGYSIFYNDIGTGKPSDSIQIIKAVDWGMNDRQVCFGFDTLDDSYLGVKIGQLDGAKVISLSADRVSTSADISCSNVIAQGLSVYGTNGITLNGVNVDLSKVYVNSSDDILTNCYAQATSIDNTRTFVPHNNLGLNLGHPGRAWKNFYCRTIYLADSDVASATYVTLSNYIKNIAGESTTTPIYTFSAGLKESSSHIVTVDSNYVALKSHTHTISDITWSNISGNTIDYYGFGHIHTMLLDGTGKKGVAIAGAKKNDVEYYGLIPYDTTCQNVNSKFDITRGGTMYLGAAYASASGGLTAYPFECAYFKDIKVYKGSGNVSDISNYITPSGGGKNYTAGTGITISNNTISVTSNAYVPYSHLNASNPHNITCSKIGAATSNHTHSGYLTSHQSWGLSISGSTLQLVKGGSTTSVTLPSSSSSSYPSSPSFSSLTVNGISIGSDLGTISTRFGSGYFTNAVRASELRASSTLYVGTQSLTASDIAKLKGLI